MRIGIIGAGPSGSYLAYLLAKQGKDVLLFDKFASREKPCGGGMTFKALDSFRLITEEEDLQRTFIKNVRVLSSNGKEFDLSLDKPLSIFSRRELDGFICRSAVKAGAIFLPEHVQNIERSERGWALKTKESKYGVDFLVGADGAKSLVRARLAGRFLKEDISLTMGYYVQGRYHQDLIICKFLEGFNGYLWSFPRHDHLSVGIITDLSRAKSSELRAHIIKFIRENYPKAEIAEDYFFSAVVPELNAGHWATNVYSGDNWALVGDSAGFVDPFTGEGIYYALRSAELLAEAIACGQLSLYRSACSKEFIEDFKWAARWKRHIPHCFSLVSRVVTGSRRSRTLQKIESWLAYNELLRGHYASTIAAIEEQISVYDPVLRRDSESFTILDNLITARRRLGEAHLALGDTASAGIALYTAKELADKLLTWEPDHADMAMNAVYVEEVLSLLMEFESSTNLHAEQPDSA